MVITQNNKGRKMINEELDLEQTYRTALSGQYVDLNDDELSIFKVYVRRKLQNFEEVLGAEGDLQNLNSFSGNLIAQKTKEIVDSRDFVLPKNKRVVLNMLKLLSKVADIRSPHYESTWEKQLLAE
jgi:hypothetical protein